ARWKCPRGYVENVAAAIVLAATDDRAAGRVYNVAEPQAFSEAAWGRMIGNAAGWRGGVGTVPGNRTSLPYPVEQSLDTNSGLLRRELGYAEPVEPAVALERTVAWEKANLAETSQAIGLLDYDAEDAVLAEIRHG